MDGGREHSSAFGLALAMLVSVALGATAAEPGAAERFRAAAALQERELFDLAAADYETLERDFANAPLADRAALARGICLFQLGKFAEASAALRPVVDRAAHLSAEEREQLLAYLGLAHYNLGQSTPSESAQQQLDAAIDVLGRHLAQFPAGRFAQQTGFYQAEAFYARGRLDDAARAYRAVLDKFPQHSQRAEALYGLVVAEQERSDFAAALDICNSFAREFPQHPSLPDIRVRHADALLSLAAAHRTAGELTAARLAAQELIARFPENANVPAAFVVLAQIQIAEHDLAAAESSLDQCLLRSTQPDVTRDAHLLRARVRYERNNHTGCLADASAVLTRDPNRAEALHLRGLAEVALGKPQDAARSLAQVLIADPHYAAADRALYDLAWALEQNQNAREATLKYLQVIEHHPQSPLVAECQFRVGQLDFTAEHLSQAAEHFHAAHSAAADAVLREKAIHQLGWCLFKQGDCTAARSTFAAQIAEFPAGPLSGDAKAMTGESCFEQSDFSSALGHFTAAMDDATTGQSLRSLALVHASQSAAELRDWEHSRDFADRAIRAFPEGERADEARYNRGLALLELGRLDEAERDLGTVAGKQTGLLTVKSELALGRIFAARHKHDEAIRLFFKVAYGHGGKAAPDSYHAPQAEAVFAAACALEETGRHEAAQKLYQELLTSYPTSARAALARQSLQETVHR